MDKKTILKETVKMLLVSELARRLVLFLINLYMTRREKPSIVNADDAAALGGVGCIMVLGCSVRPDGTPPGMSRDRLDEGVELYEGDVLDRLLMSGDHGRVNYDGVSRMKQYAIDTGISPGDIFTDHAGFSTYESIYRARDILQVKKIITVTQRYHVYRALYVAQVMGMETYGVKLDPRQYGGQKMRDLRELLARPRGLIYTIVIPKPTYLGDAIPVGGDGNVTNGKEESRDRNESIQE